MGQEFIFDDHKYVGLAAGMVWHCLGQYGPITPPQISLITGGPRGHIPQATSLYLFDIQGTIS